LLAGNDAKCLSNPFAKPFDVWRTLINNVSIVGQTLLDPFAGEGTMPLAALALGRQVLACELESTHYNYMLESAKQHFTAKYAGCSFV
jgi:DNA modification methylase